jgi:hypothetical protein
MMPFVFGIIGTLLVVSGVRGTTSELSTLVKSDFTGTPNYLEWMVAIFIIGSLGYVKELSTLSRLFMTAVVISMIFANKGVFPLFTAGISSEPLANTFNVQYGVSKPQTTSVQPSDTLQLAEEALQNTNV